MNTILETEITIGDVVELSPNKMSTLDDFDLEKCTVLEIDKAGQRIKVAFNNHNTRDEDFFSNSSIVNWYTLKHVINIERDYKVVDITDNQDTTNNQPVTFLAMARVHKTIKQSARGYEITKVINANDTETFIFVGVPYADLKQYLGNIKRISFSKFKADEVSINGSIAKAWLFKDKILDVEDIFVLQ
ncbi:hypothetical protein BDD43_1065 [Mucilaginibacter gracilis]|uniref:Uncharacterized protein n=1 Tax=Mucilaginibacter gracilis TaxID=423350 RepID=A0A495IVZ8_9SPHI|nr:hypothetical protein [Mucilaginibacter gracilis]RKR80927.1 hypothetical protein BDD43_1065 [Mucilaginibacter gracilis]